MNDHHNDSDGVEQSSHLNFFRVVTNKLVSEPRRSLCPQKTTFTRPNGMGKGNPLQEATERCEESQANDERNGERMNVEGALCYYDVNYTFDFSFAIIYSLPFSSWSTASFPFFRKRKYETTTLAYPSRFLLIRR